MPSAVLATASPPTSSSKVGALATTGPGSMKVTHRPMGKALDLAAYLESDERILEQLRSHSRQEN
jgi:hypothetical protein